ncbi:hypothetical protein DLM75_22485 [Leptospira stimsonii]|uniref:Uncharacterized protein n=1 Tax=Leptospira stimsonii TaxID=2202203 RepID=A0A396YUW7_9LEPT|nr:hypothetical protein DLM75_22485 [Leptospira stimsonii]
MKSEKRIMKFYLRHKQALKFSEDSPQKSKTKFLNPIVTMRVSFPISIQERSASFTILQKKGVSLYLESIEAEMEELSEFRRRNAFYLQNNEFMIQQCLPIFPATAPHHPRSGWGARLFRDCRGSDGFFLGSRFLFDRVLQNRGQNEL